MTDSELPEVPHGQAQPARGAHDAPLVERVRAGDPDAFGQLYDRWFERVHDLAYRVLWDEEAAADVAQEAFLSAWRNIGTLQDTNAFGGWLLRIARNQALNRKRKGQRSRPVDEERLAVIERTQTRPEDLLARANDPAQISENTALAMLLWDAADALGDRDREVLDLSLRHGLPPAEIADVLDINRNAANQLVHRVRQRLGGAVGARILWRDGTPTCAQLRAELAAADVTAFDAEALRVTDRHAGGCETCAELRRTELEPSRLFAAIPILVLPALKAKVAAALAGAGVPMDGSKAGEYEEPQPDTGKSARRTRRFLAGAAAVFVILVLVVIVGASRVGDMTAELEVGGNEPSNAAAPTTTSSTSPTTVTTTTAPVSTTTIAAPTTTAPVVVVPTTIAPVETTVAPTTIPVTTTTVAPVIRLALSPATRPRSYLMSGAGSDAPVLTWSAGPSPYEVYVSGNGLGTSKSSGTQRLCPGEVTVTANGTFCFTDGPGEYEYTVEVFNGAGDVIAEQTRTLTISP